MSDVFKDLFCGWLSGVGQVLAMMPFENIKIKVVSKPQEYTGYLQCFKKTIAEEGPFSFYKGMLTNLLGVGPQVALQFAIVQTLKKYLQKNVSKDKQKLGLNYIAFCGAVTGIPSALIQTPLDHARFRVALDKSKGQGSVKTAMKIYKKYGLQKLYLGFNSTLLREVSCGTVYFTVYQFANKWLNPDPKNIVMMNAMLAGGISGMMTWMVAYPIDFIKTLIQTDNMENPRHRSMLGYLQDEFRSGSFKRILTGIEIMLVRSFFSNGVGFVCFETGKKIMYGTSKKE